MKSYYAFVEDFTKFMCFFKHFYPELYEKYGNRISMPVKGMPAPCIKNDQTLTPVARRVLTHIITEFYMVRCN